jgi:hypothetical protein
MSAAEWNSAAQQINIGWKPIDSNSIDRVCMFEPSFSNGGGQAMRSPKTLTHTPAQF